MRTKIEILADIRRAPGVDSYRSEYANVIDAKDPAYARYIRRHLESPTTPTGPGLGDHPNAPIEQRISQPFLDRCYDVRLRRGFVEEITVDPYVFIDRGHELLELSPVQKVTFSPKPLPPQLEPPLMNTIVPSPIPEIMACPLLQRVTAIAFKETAYQCWSPGLRDMESILASPNLSGLLILTLPQLDNFLFDASQCRDLWSRAFARPEFRKMLTIGLPGYPGELTRSYDEGVCGVTEATPMREEGQALEREHGYLPSLHQATRWGNPDLSVLHDWQIILAAQRGELPLFPVGAPVADEMRKLPPRRMVTNLLLD